MHAVSLELGRHDAVGVHMARLFVYGSRFWKFSVLTLDHTAIVSVQSVDWRLLVIWLDSWRLPCCHKLKLLLRKHGSFLTFSKHFCLIWIIKMIIRRRAFKLIGKIGLNLLTNFLLVCIILLRCIILIVLNCTTLGAIDHWSSNAWETTLDSSWLSLVGSQVLTHDSFCVHRVGVRLLCLFVLARSHTFEVKFRS